MFKEFKDFIVRGNVMDMAVGIIVGAAFGTIIQSLVKDVIMPPIGLLLGNVDFTNIFTVLREGEAAAPYATLADAQQAGAVTMNWGVFVMTVIAFVIIAFCIFLIIKRVNKLSREEEAPPAEPTTKECPHCFSEISIKASRCPFCTSELGAPAQA